MVNTNRGALALLAVLIAVAIWFFFFRDSSAPAPQAAAARPAAGRKTLELAWINVERLTAENPVVSLGRRNIFEYQATPPPLPPSTMPSEEVAMNTAPPTPPGPTPTPPPPPIQLKFMGVIKAKDGPRIAVLQTEQKEILHGREGDVLAGRYKIVEIKLESIDVQEVGSGHKQTLRIGGR